MDVAHVWVAKDDGTDMVRAEEIARVGIDDDGTVTAQLTSGDGATVTLVDPSTQHGEHTPDDFHRQLIRALAELSDAAGAFLVRPVCDEQHGWRWDSEAL
jgi:hypothetical protein